jgi:AraC family transcriptional regulator
MNVKRTPTLTSAETLASYPPGQALRKSQGPASRDVQMSVFSQTEEREPGGTWVTTHIRPGSLFLTMAGAPYTFKWRRLSAEPLEVVLILLGMPVFEAALQEVVGARSQEAHFRNVSGVEDAKLVALLECVRWELDQSNASALFVRGMADAIAVHLARHYIDVGASLLDGSALPAYKLRLVTLWMSEHLAEPFSLAALAEVAGVSEFHFNRLFKKATGMPPSQYQIKLRMETARRVLRETAESIVDIGNEVGYSNASHFAQQFRKETGATPSDYRRQR